jgi:glycosyltransferase involved in cell wall biosynthesis
MHEMGGPRSPLRVALYSGLCVRYDAISNSLRHKLDLFDSWQRSGVDLECVAFVHSSDYDDPRIRRVDSVAKLLRMPEFRSADIHIFEFGIHYPLFDAVFLLPDGVPAIGIYHNVTPPELADNAALRDILERSLIQRHNLSRMSWVVSQSEYSRQQLLDLGLPAERLVVIPLPPAHELQARRRSPGRAGGERVEVLYVGRFVRAKGVLDLLAAASILARQGGNDFRLTMAGNPSLSSPDVLEEVATWCARDPLGTVRVVPAPDDGGLAALYSGADVFVMPSYHEGYCVPVVEALAAGCQVVAYDSSNLPSILGGLGTLVPTSDVQQLAAALANHIERIRVARSLGKPLLVPTELGEVEEEAWQQLVVAHLDRHSIRAFEAGFGSLFQTVLADSGIEVPAGAGNALPLVARSG